MLRLRRRWSSVASVAAVAGLLVMAGCGKSGSTGTATPSGRPSIVPSASASASPSATPQKVTPSKNLDALKVTGGYGHKPTVTFQAPWGIDKTQTKVLLPSSGPVVRAGTSVQVNYLGLDGRTGQTFDESFSKGAPVSFPLGQVIPGFSKGLLGQRQGSRVVIAMTGPDGYDSAAASGSGPPGISVGDTLIFVVDLVQVTLDGPSGAKVTPKAGLPTVTDVGGKPTVTVPKTAPPTTLVVQPLIKGTGPKVTASATIVSHYVAARWSDGKVVATDYGQAPGSGPLSGTLTGLRKGLVDQTVGSRVLLVLPPAEGYPQGNASPSVGLNETLVFVVDLLYAAPAAAQ